MYSTKTIINLSLAVVFSAVIFSCDSAKSQTEVVEIENVKEVKVEIDSTSFLVADSLMKSITKREFQEAKQFCETECVLGYFLKSDVDEIKSYDLVGIENKKGLDLITVSLNNNSNRIRLVFNNNKLVFIWPKKRMIWNDCLPNDIVWDNIYEISEEENGY